MPVSDTRRDGMRPMLLALAALVVAYVWLIQPAGDNEKSHYALVRALADGRPYVDEVRTNPALRTIDVTEHGEHVYAAKSPGLAVVSVPAYVVLRELGVQAAGPGPPKRMLWALHLWSVVVPALVLLLLVARVADSFDAGTGVAAAVAVGTSTLVLPFATLFYSHELAALLAFGSFVLLRGGRVLAAGVLAGYGITTETSLVLVAVVLAFYACTQVPRARRALSFAAGTLAGASPLLVFNWWALGSPFRSTYSGWKYPGDENAVAFDLSVPTPASLLQVLLYPTGIPLLTAALVGLVLLHRRNPREARAALAIGAGFVLLNATFPEPLGGASPGPRYLIPAFPFLALGLAPALRRLRGETAGLAVAGAVMLTAITITSPNAAFDHRVIQRLRDHSVVSTVLELVGVTSGYAVLVFVAAVALALLAAAATLALREPREWIRAAAAAAAFAIVGSQVGTRLDAASTADLLIATGIAAGSIGTVIVVRFATQPRTVS